MSEREGSGVDRLGRSALHYAATSGDLAAVQAAVDAGADVCAGDSAGWTPLHFAAQAEKADIAIEAADQPRRCGCRGRVRKHAAVAGGVQLPG
ncbi:ankyrin repeat domain-containing protein [Streptomyces mirabilis]|uniref:ankyrin repeat domain-containing protein n=1 Tax=Streptomyces mirabilis TaxID=68239 RepID=UPI0036B11D87